MTFSSYLKSELIGKNDPPRHCSLAELAGLLMFAGKCKDGRLSASTENPETEEKIIMLIERLFKTEPAMTQKKNARGRTLYVMETDDVADVHNILSGLKTAETQSGEIVPSQLVFTQSCCKKAFLRGAFISSGTISDPDKSYHCEFTCKRREQAELIMKAAEGLGMPLRYIQRGRYHIVYEKESDAISLLLGNMGARVSLLELENRRIVREMRGNVNRQVNCETANINKTAEAAARVIEDIEFIVRTKGMKFLSPQLREIALARQEYPEAPLKDLGEMLDPPVGKSGVNHRLRKISQIADELRGEIRHNDE